MAQINFDKTLHKTHEWLHDVKNYLELEDEGKTYLITKAVLHTLRDRLTIEEVFQFGEQLPMLMKGFYYERYKPANKPIKFKKAEFIKAIFLRMPETKISPEEAIAAVTQMIKMRISNGEIKDIIAVLPKDLKELFR